MNLTPEQQTALRAAMDRATELRQKADRSAEETTELAACLDTAERIVEEAKLTARAGTLDTIFSQPDPNQPKPGMARAGATDGNGGRIGEVKIESVTAAGHTDVHFESTRAGQIYMLAKDYGEGTFDPEFAGVVNTEEYRKTFRSYLRSGRYEPEPGVMRTMQEGVDTAGGYFVPEDIANFVISREPTPTRVAGRVTQLQTGRDALVIPKVVYTTDDLNVGVAA